MPAAAIHGNKSQSARVRALEDFRSGKIRILVATDIAARGIDVKGIDLVVNYDLPNEPDSYVHRIGRTARAGSEGRAISLCDEKSQGLLRQIEKTIRTPVPIDTDHDYHRDPQPGDRDEKRSGGNRGGRSQGGRGQNSRGGSSRGGNSRGGNSGGGGGNRNSRNRRRPGRQASSV
jgi:ATP-dependent RNA helicase RhlE